jgi:hypothetical protein
MAQIIRPGQEGSPVEPQKTEELGSAPPQTEHLMHDSPDSEPAGYSTQTAETIQAEIPTDSEMTVPHSGNLGLEKPVREFDKTTLQEAVDSNLIKIPTVKPEQSQRPWYKSTLAKVGAGVVAGASLLGIGAKLGGGNDADAPAERAVAAAEPLTPTTEAPTAPVSETPTTDVPPLPDAVYDYADQISIVSNEVLVPEAEDSQELVDTLYHNFACAFNYQDLSEKCFAAFAKNPEDSGWDKVREAISLGAEYRIYSPNFGVTFETKVLHDSYTPGSQTNTRTIEVEVWWRQGYDGDYSGPESETSHTIQRIGLERGSVNGRPGWLVVDNKTIEQFENTFHQE